MGRKITATRAGTCPNCGNGWAIQDQIYWDNSVKNSKGWNVTCSDEECFKGQGGTLTGFTTQKKTPFTGFSGRFTEDVSAILPAVAVGKEIIASSDIVLQAFTQANSIATDIYKKLPNNSQTFGQIRSKFTDQILKVYCRLRKN